MTGLPAVSVIVPTFQRRASVRRMLEALRHQSVSPDDYEVIVVVDGSRDGTLEMLREFNAPYALKSVFQENSGRAGACNTGLRESAGDLLIILDDDMEPTPSLIAGHRSAHGGHQRRAVVGAAPIVSGPSSPPLVRFYADGFNWRQRQLAAPGHELGFRETYSGNFSIRREAFMEVGGFDPEFRVYGHEDYELALRLQRAGVELVFSSEALAYQHYEKDLRQLARDGVSRGRTAVLFAEKHPEIVETLQLSRYQQARRAWRLVRAVLLAAGRVLPSTPEILAGVMMWLERRRPALAMKLYGYALDFFYWHGARSAMRERHA